MSKYSNDLYDGPLFILEVRSERDSIAKPPPRE